MAINKGGEAVMHGGEKWKGGAEGTLWRSMAVT